VPQQHRALHCKKKEWCDAMQKQKVLHRKNKKLAPQKERVVQCDTSKKFFLNGTQ